MSRVNLSFLGIRQAGASDDLVYKGRRRMVACNAFIVFVLIAAALTDEEWISGGLEYTFESVQQLSNCEQCGGHIPGYQAELTSIAAGRPDLGATFSNFFQVGLDKMSIDSEYDYRYTGVRAQRDCIYDLKPYLDEINAATGGSNSTWNIWYGLSPLSVVPFNAAKGLLGFAGFLQIAAWLLLVGVQYEIPYISANKAVLWVVRGMLAGATFFTIIGLAQFGAAPIKNEFCRAFDPDGASGVTGLPCGFGNGVNIAIAAIVLGAVGTVLSFAWMTLDLPQAYAFSGKGGYEPTGTSGSSSGGGFSSGSAPLSGGYNADGDGGASGSSGVTGSAYQTIGVSSS